MKTRNICLVLALCILIGLMAACSTSTSSTDSPGETPATKAAASQAFTVTDVLGRKVSFEKAPESLVALGANTLRLVCYLDAADKVIGIETFEEKPTIYRPYGIAYPDLAKLPVVAESMGAADVEQIMALGTDVIFCSYPEAEDADNLQSSTGIPVVCVKYSKGVFGDDFYSALRIVAETLGESDKAETVIDYVEECKNDLVKRTENIPDEGKLSVYMGGENFNGWHGIDGTNSEFVPLDIIGGKNVAADSGTAGTLGAFLVDLEQIFAWNPDYIVLNVENLGLVEDQYKSNPNLFKSLKAVQNGTVYKSLPYLWYGTNTELALIDAYYLGTLLYPEQFADIDIAKKSDEIFNAMLSTPLYDACQEATGGCFGKYTIGG